MLRHYNYTRSISCPYIKKKKLGSLYICEYRGSSSVVYGLYSSVHENINFVLLRKSDATLFERFSFGFNAHTARTLRIVCVLNKNNGLHIRVRKSDSLVVTQNVRELGHSKYYCRIRLYCIILFTVIIITILYSYVIAMIIFFLLCRHG